MAKLEIPLNMNPSLTAALEKVSAYAGRLEVERKDLVDKLNHAESVIHDLTGDKELLKSELERSRDMANYSHGQLYSMNEYCLKNGFEFVQNNPALTMIHEMGKLRSERDALAAQVELLQRKVFETYNFQSNTYTDDSNGALKAFELVCDCFEVAKLTPQQCLAEIKAEAGRAGFVECIKFVRLGIEPNSDHAKQYADKIRNAGTWLRDENVNGGTRQGGE